MLEEYQSSPVRETAMRRLTALLLVVIVVHSTVSHGHDAAIQFSPSVRLLPGPVNGVSIERDGHCLIVYGDPSGTVQQADIVLFTHSRRDVVWAGRDLVRRGAKAIVPAAEASAFTKPDEFWRDFLTARFHDYRQQTTKVPVMPLEVDRSVADGDTIPWQDLAVKVMGTPGYTRGAVSYLLKVDGIKYAFVGDLIYGDGQLLDLYSLQDEVPELRIGGYHGYASRGAQLIASLRAIASEKPDLLVPVRGPAIRDPQASIARLIGRLQTVYRNYLSISAGHYYFRGSYDALAARMLGTPHGVPWMRFATMDEDPAGWMRSIGNSRLLLSESGTGWLIDCGSQAIIDEIKKLRDAGQLTSLEGVFITHYHDDHTDRINALLEDFPCPVIVTPLMADVLKRPDAYRLPCLTTEAIDRLTVVPHGHTRRWREFQLTFYDYPGQTLYHDAMLVEHDNGQKLFFLGDSFTPSGIDDYCLLNRNLMHEGDGYMRCLEILGTLPSDCMLVNEHVSPVFQFDEAQLKLMQKTLNERKALLADLCPWDEANYGIDERWARICPYGQTAQPGESVELQIRILNHSDRPHEYTVTPHVPDSYRTEPQQARLTVEPRQEEFVTLRIAVPASASESVCMVTADVAFDEWDLRHWCEALIEIRP